MRETVRRAIEECSQMEKFNLVTRLGNDMLINGGEIFRANEAMSHAARVLGLEGFNAYVIANGIFSTAVIDGRFYSSRICYVPLGPVVLCRVDALNQLSRRIEAGKCGPYEMRAELERIERMESAGNAARILASGAGSASFCYLFGGSFFDAFAAFLAGLVLYVFLIYAAPRISVSRIIRTILASGTVALFCCVAHRLGLGDSLDRIMIGAVFPLAPGIALTNSFRNFLENDYLSGLIRLADAFLTAGCIAIGVGAVMRLWLTAEENSALAAASGEVSLTAVGVALQLAAAFLGTVAFSVLFSVPQRHWAACGVTGAVGWAVYLAISVLNSAPIAAAFVASGMLTILSRYLAVSCRAPTILFLLCGIFTLVPGAGIYYTAYYVFMGEEMTALRYGLDTIKTAVAIGLGIGGAYSLPPVIFGWKKEPEVWVEGDAK